MSISTTGQNTQPDITIDVRLLPPPERHARIFHMLGLLDGGEHITLVNDHDPAPLHRQLEWVQPGVFSWEYLLEGPSEWHVRIARKGSAGCNCSCGTH